MDSDEVSSINDTVESQQVAKVIKSTYFDIINRANLPDQYTLFQLNASGDASKPTLMTLPSGFESIKWIKYDSQTSVDDHPMFKQILPLPLEEFLHIMHLIDSTADNVGTFVQTIGVDDITFIYYNDRAPIYYTSFDDGTVIFDGYDSAVDTTLQRSKSMGWGKKNIDWTMDDSFIPDLDDKEFPLLLNEAKSLAFAEAKQTAHPLAERNAKRNWTKIQKTKAKIQLSTDLDQLPNFGRR
jgi:hypothetical protein